MKTSLIQMILENLKITSYKQRADCNRLFLLLSYIRKRKDTEERYNTNESALAWENLYDFC